MATVGDFRPCSYADSVGREVPARRASSSWVRPELTRTCSSSSAAFIIRLVYPMRYSIRLDTNAGWHSWARSSFRAPRRDAPSSAPPVPGGAVRSIAASHVRDIPEAVIPGQIPALPAEITNRTAAMSSLMDVDMIAPGCWSPPVAGRRAGLIGEPLDRGFVRSRLRTSRVSRRRLMSVIRPIARSAHPVRPSPRHARTPGAGCRAISAAGR